jgi:hypothetical protein
MYFIKPKISFCKFYQSNLVNPSAGIGRQDELKLRWFKS